MFDLYDAEVLFGELLISLISFSIIFSFALVGFTFKIFQSFVSQNASHEPQLAKWRFGASNVFCYFYIAVAILALISYNDGSIFAKTLITLNTVLSTVFAYLGIRFAFHLMITGGRSSFFAISVIIIAFILFSSYIISILSYVGVVVTIIDNKASVASN